MDTPALNFVPLNEAEREHDWVTLVQCGNLFEADAIAMELRGEDIPVFLPDEFSTQTFGFVNTACGVRVQVAPADYERARETLVGNREADDPTNQGAQGTTSPLKKLGGLL
jgi:hypothetical protein